MSTTSKPILYTFPFSVWSAAAELASAELGYTDESLETKVVNVIEGENLAPWFVDINPNGTIPTLSVGGKSYNSTAEVLSYLVPNAPKPLPAGSTADKELITTIHDGKYEPNFGFVSARNEAELQAKGDAIVKLYFSNRQAALKRYAASPEGIPHSKFYESKLGPNTAALAIYTGTSTEAAKAKWFADSQVYWTTGVPEAIFDVLASKLPKGGFIDGTVPGETDFHVAAWLTSTSSRAGATSAADAVKSLESALGKALPEQVVGYWKAWTERDSWKQVYAARLR